MVLRSSLESGMFPFKGSYFLIFNKSSSKVMFRTTAPAATVINREYNFFVRLWIGKFADFGQ